MESNLHREKTNDRNAPIPLWVKLVISLQFVLILVLFFFTFELRISPVDIKYSEWIAILLTGVSLLIALLAVFLGVLAFIGWQNFDQRVGRHTQECLEKGFSRDGKLRRHLEESVDAVSYRISMDFGEVDEVDNLENEDDLR